MIVKVAFPVSIPGIYDYTVPGNLQNLIVPGIPVRVPLRSRMVWGVVVATAEQSPFKSLKDVVEIKQTHWADANSSLIKLYEWVASYYHCSLGRVFRPLVRKGVVNASAKMRTVFKFSGLTGKDLTPKQRIAVEQIRSLEAPVTREILREKFGISTHMVSALESKCVLERITERIMRAPGDLMESDPSGDVVLTEEQTSAVETISASFGKPSEPFLLFGITGSGKTHVYIELVRRCLSRNSRAIILVPEISLTPQTIRRFKDALGDVIAVVHSRMSDGERRDSLEEIVSGAKSVAIGVRSVVLSPMENVGCIIVDEEHDHSYKQDDMEPRYNARDVAVMRGRLQNAVVVLGSATPSMESYYNAEAGKYRLIRLVSRFGEASLPSVSIADMNEEHKQNNWTLLSVYLKNRMEQVLSEGRQIILLLNRRGFSSSLICKSCGFSYVCPNCSVHLVYHRDGTNLQCHQCGYWISAPSICPKCRGEQIKYSGTGIQKAEEFIKSVFPAARILRMDQDSTRKKGQHVSIIDAFARHEADILLGTQMVAKGLNFHGVRLVGVLHADIGLHFPDFRASEKTFQLLTQVAGRAGRSDSLGEVVVQTYMPGEPGILMAQKHDFEGFYRMEIDSRKTLGYPPFGKLARIVLDGTSESEVKNRAAAIGRAISSAGGEKLTLLGPSPAMLSRLKNRFRYSMLIKSSHPGAINDVLARVKAGESGLPKGIRMVIDMDPVDML